MCSVSNGGCSHLCLATGPDSRTCACPSYPDPRECISGKLSTKSCVLIVLTSYCLLSIVLCNMAPKIRTLVFAVADDRGRMNEENTEVR